MTEKYNKLDEKLINELVENNKNVDLNFELFLDDKLIKLTNVQIIKAKTPVKRAINRGGVYFSDTITYKIKSTTNNFTILDRLKTTMLGPNDAFEDLELRTSNFILICNLTNTMQTSSSIVLNMNIKDIKIVNA